jgi:hypothetical protein
MTFDEIEVGKMYRDTLNDIVGTVIGKYDGLLVQNVDFQPKSLDGVNKVMPYWAFPLTLEEI